MPRISVSLLLAALLFGPGCTERPAQTTWDAPESSSRATGKITGFVTYRERVALTDRAVLEVRLEDVTRQDVAAETIAQTEIPDPGQVPIRFELEFDPDAIDPGRAYAVRLRISDRGRLAFINDTQIPVLTRGGGREVRATLTAVGNPGASAGTPASGGTALRGYFRYLADAAQFTDCRTDQTFPVAMEGAYIEVERAYLDADVEAGQPVLIELQGRYLERARMEGKINKIKLIIDEFDKILADGECEASSPTELVGTYWKLLDLAGEPVVLPAGQAEAHLVLESAGQRVRGNAGCNTFFGGYVSDDETLSFGALGSTMMACPEGMDVEQAFLRALEQTRRFEIAGLILTLFADDEPLARFEAVDI